MKIFIIIIALSGLGVQIWSYIVQAKVKTLKQAETAFALLNFAGILYGIARYFSD